MAVSDWGDVIAVYQRPSGETHAFNGVTAALLRTLHHGPGSLDALVQRVAMIVGAAEDDVSAEDFLRVVLRLEELGLIDRAHAGVIAA